MDTQSPQTADYSGIALAMSAIIVMVLSRVFNISTDTQTIASIILGIVGVIGGVKQIIAHRNVVAVANAAIAGSK